MLWFPGRNPTGAKYETVQEHIKMNGDYIRNKNLDIFFGCEIEDIGSLQAMNAGYTSYACTETVESVYRQNQALAFMSKFPWEEIWWIDFSKVEPSPTRPARGVLAARFKVKGRDLYIYGVHLKSNLDGVEKTIPVREKTIDALLKNLKDRKLDPNKEWIIILGDFNTSHGVLFQKETTLKKIEDLGFVEVKDGLFPEERITMPQRKNSPLPSEEFDRIYLSPALVKQMKTPSPWGKVHRATWKHSDHRMVTVDVPLL